MECRTDAGRHPQIGMPWPQQPQPQRPDKVQPSDLRSNNPADLNHGHHRPPSAGHHRQQIGQPQLIVPLPPTRPVLPAAQSAPATVPVVVPVQSTTVHPARSIESQNYFNHVRQQQQQYHYAVADYEEEQEPEEDYYNEEEEEEVDLGSDYSTTESSISSSTEHTPLAAELHPHEQTSDEDHIDMDILTVFGLSGLASLPYTPRTVPQDQPEDVSSDTDSAVGENEPKFEAEAEEVEEHSPDESESNQEVNEEPPTTPSPVPRKLPALLPPPTPPGKRVIGAGNQPPLVAKPIDNHRGSYGLSAASVYARLKPSMQFPNASARPKDVSRPYRKRPISPTTTTTPEPPHGADEDETPVYHPPAGVHEGEDEPYSPEESAIVEDDSDPVYESEMEDHPHQFEPELETPVQEEVEEELQVEESGQQETRHEQVKTHPQEKHPVAPETIRNVIRLPPAENETLKPPVPVPVAVPAAPVPIASLPVAAVTAAAVPATADPVAATPAPAAPAAVGAPVDIKELLRSAGSVSLSEYLQQKGMTLADLLRGGTSVLAAIAPNAAPGPSFTKSAATATPSTTPSTTSTTAAPRAPVPERLPPTIPEVKPINFRELLAGKNISLSELLGPTLKNGAPLPIPASPTLKPGVKMPVPFIPRFKGLHYSASPEPTADERSQEEDEITTTTTTTSKPTASLKPLIFGGLSPAESTSTTAEATEGTTTPSTTTLRSRRPYFPPNNIGEYGSHGPVDDESEEESNGTKSIFTNFINYGNQRPIATSRLTPPPPRKQRPVLNFNYNTYAEEEEDTGEEVNTSTTIATHFNEDELNEDEEGYFNLPVSVQSAIIVSSTIIGFCLIVFIVILVIFKIRQKSRIRLRHPNAALLGALSVSGAGSGTAGSDGSSGVTTPIPPLKGGYAKLPLRSSSLWGTLRRSMRQLDSNFSY